MLGAADTAHLWMYKLASALRCSDVMLFGRPNICLTLLLLMLLLQAPWTL